MTAWMDKARSYIGQSEIKGPKHNPFIISWWQKIKATIFDDEAAWCAAFVGGVLEECGIRSSRAANARSYLAWGQALNAPAIGAIVVFWRGSPRGWQGHVGFVAGRDRLGNLMVFGGNQDDAVNIRAFGTHRLLGYRWPNGHMRPTTGFDTLPIISSNGKISTNEA